MNQFKGKKSNKFWHSPLMLIVLFLVLVLFAYNMVGLLKKERETSKNKASELSKIEELRKREATLSSEIEKLNTEYGVEESIREKFQVVKPDEKMVVIVEEKEKVSILEKDSKDHSFWGYVKKVFGFGSK